MSKKKPIRPINSKLFDFDRSTSTFIQLMMKYHKQKKQLQGNDKLYMAKIVYNKLHELEMNEKENMYIYRETKNAARINQELINEYGKKAKNHSYDVSKYKANNKKIGKITFFDPTDETYKILNETKKSRNKGFIKLPLISEYELFEKKPMLTYNNTNFNRTRIKKNILQKKEKLLKINNKNDFSFERNKILNTPKNKKNNDSNKSTETNIYFNTCRICKSDRNRFTEIDQIAKKQKKRNKFRERNGNLYCSGKNIFSYNGPYLKTLSNFKDQLINQERTKRNFFNRNDYGCNLFKEKYTFINKKYFE